MYLIIHTLKSNSGQFRQLAVHHLLQKFLCVFLSLISALHFGDSVQVLCDQTIYYNIANKSKAHISQFHVSTRSLHDKYWQFEEYTVNNLFG